MLVFMPVFANLVDLGNFPWLSESTSPFSLCIELVVVRLYRMPRSLDADPNEDRAHHTGESGITRVLGLVFEMYHVEVEVEVSMGMNRL